MSDSQPCKGHPVTKHTAGGLTLIRRTKVDLNFLLPLSSDLKLFPHLLSSEDMLNWYLLFVAVTYSGHKH